MSESKKLLKFWCQQGWKYRCIQRPDLKDQKEGYSKRLGYELKIICDKDFQDYFLAVSNLIRWSKDNNIDVGPGRGSGAGSLVCYLLRITEIDPMHPTFSRMIFERFVDPNRVDLPDLDIDIND